MSVGESNRSDRLVRYSLAAGGIIGGSQAVADIQYQPLDIPFPEGSTTLLMEHGSAIGRAGLNNRRIWFNSYESAWSACCAYASTGTCTAWDFGFRAVIYSGNYLAASPVEGLAGLRRADPGELIDSVVDGDHVYALMCSSTRTWSLDTCQGAGGDWSDNNCSASDTLLLAFSFEGSTPRHGWIEFVGEGDAMRITGWAYEDSGGPIVVGDRGDGPDLAVTEVSASASQSNRSFIAASADESYSPAAADVDWSHGHTAFGAAVSVDLDVIGGSELVAGFQLDDGPGDVDMGVCFGTDASFEFTLELPAGGVVDIETIGTGIASWDIGGLVLPGDYDGPLALGAGSHRFLASIDAVGTVTEDYEMRLARVSGSPLAVSGVSAYLFQDFVEQLSDSFSAEGDFGVWGTGLGASVSDQYFAHIDVFDLGDGAIRIDGVGRGTLAEVCKYEQDGQASLQATVLAREPFLLECMGGQATYGEFGRFGDVVLDGDFSQSMSPGEYLIDLSGLVDFGECSFTVHLSPDVGIDCDGNGVDDKQQIGEDPSLDRNQNLVLDLCEDPVVFDVPSVFPTVQSAVEVGQDGDVIRIAAGTYTEAIDFAGKAITIEGDVADPAAVVLDGTDLVDSSVVRMVAGEGPDSILRGVTIRNGTSGTAFLGTFVGGAIHTLESSPTIEDCVLEQNAAPYGGAVYARKGAPVFRRCVFRDNRADEDGGGFQFSRTEGGVLEDCVFQGNEAGNNGGAIHLFGGDPTLLTLSVSGNSAAAAGGGVSWASTGGPAWLDSVDIHGNTAGAAGALYIAAPSLDLTLSDSVLCGNEPDAVQGDFIDGGGNCESTLCIELDGEITCDDDGCPADYSGNGVVNGTDLGVWLAYAGKPCDPDIPCPGDLDGDGQITGGDLGVLLSNWGVCE